MKLNDGIEDINGNEGDYFMPTFLLKKGIRLNYDKTKNTLISSCYPIE